MTDVRNAVALMYNESGERESKKSKDSNAINFVANVEKVKEVGTSIKKLVKKYFYMNNFVLFYD